MAKDCDICGGPHCDVCKWEASEGEYTVLRDGTIVCDDCAEEG